MSSCPIGGPRDGAARSPAYEGARTEGFEPDVIVVGGGSAGAAAARRLVDRDVRVLLLEAGGPDVNPAIHDPGRLHELWLSEEDWAYETVPQAHASGRRLAWPRGRVLGGSSCLNAMIWVRGARADYDDVGVSRRRRLGVGRRAPGVRAHRAPRSGRRRHRQHPHRLRGRPDPPGDRGGCAGMRDSPQRRLQRRHAGRRVVHAVQHRERHPPQHRRGVPAADRRPSEPAGRAPRPGESALVRGHAVHRRGVRTRRQGRARARVRGHPVRRNDRLGAAAAALGRRSGRRAARTRGRGRGRPRGRGAEPPRPPALAGHLHGRARGRPAVARPTRLSDAPLLAIPGRARRSGHPADPLHGPHVRALDGGPGERVHAHGWHGAAAEPRDDPPERPDHRRSAADRPEHPRLRGRSRAASLLRSSSAAGSEPRTPFEATGVPSSAIRDRTSPPRKRSAATSGTRRSRTTTRSGTCKMGLDEAAVVDPRLRVHGIDGLRVARRIRDADGARRGTPTRHRS